MSDRENVLVVGFFTAGSEYEQEAEAMAESVRKYGLEVVLINKPCMGSWAANCAWKPQVLRDVARHNYGRTILYMDADARMVGEPTLLDDFEADFARATYRGGTLSGTLLFRVNDRTNMLLAAWCKQQQSHPTRWDQSTLHDVLGSDLPRASNLDLVDLPWEYCKIFDKMKGTKPIIEQFQASRRLKGRVQPKKVLGVAIAACDIPNVVFERFWEHLETVTKGIPIVQAIYTDPSVGPFNLSRAKNNALRNLPACDVAVCVDVDCLPSREMIEQTMNECVEGKLVWSRVSDVDADDIYGKPFRDKRPGRGGWIAMTPGDWRKVGGWDERCFGWGGDDNVLHKASKREGIEAVELDGDLLHVRHEPYNAGCEKPRLGNSTTNGERNLLACKSPSPRNYLTDGFSLYGRHSTVVLNVRSKCNYDCPHCSNRAFRKHAPDYEMTAEQVERFIQASEASGYVLDVILSGGEPTLWNNLVDGVDLLHASDAIKSISLFTNMADPDRLEAVLSKLNRVRMSRYSGKNEAVVDQYADQPKFEVHDASVMFPLPEPVIKEKSGHCGRCSCPYGAVFGDTFLVCAGLATAWSVYGSTEEEMDKVRHLWTPVATGFLSHRRGLTPGKFDLCSACVSCSCNQAKGQER